MGRPPCCDKDGIKKGPWTPEEDIILVSYIQQHGPGNWRSVPTNTGLLRCSKSCRLRWTNYLRPGIKRGNFTPHEESMIIHFQALLGNNSTSYASSTENISRLLQAWMRSSPNNTKLQKQETNGSDGGNGNTNNDDQHFSHEEEFDSMDLSFEDDMSNNNDNNCNIVNVGNGDCDSILDESIQKQRLTLMGDNNDNNNNPPLTFLEKWLLDETSSQVEEAMADLPPMF
ncbi:hypothetical protein Ancab_033211 [Ancistrocladus abbreviatus]